MLTLYFRFVLQLTVVVCVFLLFYSYFIPTLFCRVGVVPFISSLAVGFIMVVASVVLIFSIEKVCTCMVSSYL